MRSLLGLFLCVSVSFGVNAANSVQGYFDLTKDGSKFKTIFQEGLSAADLSSINYAVQGMSHLNEAIPNKDAICKKIKDLAKTLPTVEQSYYATTAVEKLQCKDALHPDTLKTVMKTLDDTKATLSDLMYAVYSLKALGNKGYDKNTAIKTLQEYLKKDDSVNNLGLVFHICAEVGCGTWAFERIEDAVIQADEVDGKLLHWEGGLPVTALVLTGIIKLTQVEKKPYQINAEQSVKLGNYLLSRRSVQTVKGAAVLLEAITYLADEKAISPVCISIKGNSQVGTDSEPIQISISDLMGRNHPSVTADSVVAQSVTRLSDDVVVLSKQKLAKHSKESTVYTLDLMKVKPERGQYKLALSAGSSSATLPIRALGAIDIGSVEVGVGDVDGSSSPRLNTVTHPNKLALALEADSLQKVIIKFALREKGQTKIAKVHQTFVRIYSKAMDHEVIFVAELESLKTYKMEVDVGSVADKFNYNSGLYGMEVIIGDAIISNPIRWIVAEVNLKFATANEAKPSPVVRDVKPEIFHMFREPDARPLRLVSDIFTALCIAPLLILFILWAKIGINVRNFPFSLSALGFHLGFGSILGLFIIFWLRLTMFETIRYLLILGLVTFICGHRLLSNIATKRKRVQ
ncbi:oligosaccharide transferase delta subunit [Arctopsyche grandis]|uniref:oligosaccharide transferase delta subunit n=1 Tax=Arctopsyche grandis TaxID=121162 RepID=UPI00406D670B